MNKAMVGGVLTVLSLSIPAVAATTDTFQFKGQSAYASFSQYDGCNSTSVNVYAFDNVTRSAPGAPTSQKEASLYYSNYNYCNGTGSYGYGSSPKATFTSDNSLKSATLNGTFTVNDYQSGNDNSSGTTKTVDVALTWTGTGDTFRGNSHSHSQGPGYTSNYRSVGAYRDAQVSGSVTLDGTNLISNLSSYGSLNSSNSGSVQISRR